MYSGSGAIDPRHAASTFPSRAVFHMTETTTNVPCGLTVVSPQDGGGWYTNFIGVATGHRRRGVARALKLASLAFTAFAGAPLFTIHNDALDWTVQRKFFCTCGSNFCSPS